MSKINEIIVLQIPDIGDPRTAYLLDNGDGTHDRYVSDEDGNISKQAGGIKTIQAGANITIDNTDPKNPIISSTGGGSSNETDPIFSASPSATITNSDINNWNNKLNTEIDTLESVVNRGNYSPKYMTFTGTTAVPTRYGAIGVQGTNYYFGNINENVTGQNNISLGLNSLKSITSGYSNTVIGTNAGQNITTAYENALYGKDSGNALVTGMWNVAFGEGSMYNITDALMNTAVGDGSLSLSSGRHVYNTAVGANSLRRGGGNKNGNIGIGQQSGYQITGNNNIFIGNGAGANISNSNKLYIHNNRILDNGTNGGSGTFQEYVGTNSLVYGDFVERWLQINGSLKLSTTYMPNAQGDSTYTKQLVAKPNGDIGWEDKSTGAKRWSDASIINTKLVKNTTKWTLNFDIVNLPPGINSFEVKFYAIDRAAPEMGYKLPQYYNLIPKRNGTILSGMNIKTEYTFVNSPDFTVSTYTSGNIPSSVQTFFCDNIEFLFADNNRISASSPTTAGILITIMLKADAGSSGQEQVQILQSYVN